MHVVFTAIVYFVYNIGELFELGNNKLASEGFGDHHNVVCDTAEVAEKNGKNI